MLSQAQKLDSTSEKKIFFFFAEKRTCKKLFVIAEEKGDYVFVLATIEEVDNGLLVSTHKSDFLDLKSDGSMLGLGAFSPATHPALAVSHPVDHQSG